MSNFMIVLIPYINLSNLSWIIKCIFFEEYGVFNECILCISGASMILCRKFSASTFWNDCRRHKATSFNYIGELCRYLMAKPPVSELER